MHDVSMYVFKAILNRIRSASESTVGYSSLKQKSPEELEANICSKVT